MEFRTPVALPRPTWTLAPCARILLVGSCFAGGVGQRMTADKFRAVVNPHGVMYNPVSVGRSVRRWLADADAVPDCAMLTLGTNRVYRLLSTGEIVDNCAKRPASLFREEKLSVDECVACLDRAVDALVAANAEVHVVLTVSPIRYAKYGFHGSRLAKATLLLAAERVAVARPDVVTYFPAYEILDDELRDYRFYAPDMLHPSEQAVDYIYDAVGRTFFADATHAFLAQWRPLRAALAHRPFHPDSAEHLAFRRQTEQSLRELAARYPQMPL